MRIALAVALVVAPLGAAPQDPQRPVFRSGVDLVRVDVSVRDGQRIVTGLTAADFEVLDNGVAQQIDDASFGRLPIDVTIALDISQSVTGPLLERLRQGVVQLMRDMKPEDRLKLMIFNARATRVVDFTADVKAVEKAIKEVRAGGGTALADTIGVALISAPRSERRQIVVFFTDGADASSITDRDTLRDVAQRTDATLVMVMPELLTAADAIRPVDIQNLVNGLGPRRFFDSLTADTGGTVVGFTPAVSLSSLFSRILNDFRSNYVLHYRPRGIERPGYHALTVRVKKEGLRVSARKGYFGS